MLYSYIFKTETRVFFIFFCNPKHTYTRPEEADVTSLLNSICNFDFVVTIVIVQMCLAFKKGLSRSLDLIKFTLFKTLPMSSDLSCSDLVEDLCKLE
jgi:hypothetical protein